MSSLILCDNHANYPAALFCGTCSAILCKMCVDVEPQGYVCNTCKSPCQKCSANELETLSANRPARPKSDVQPAFKKRQTGIARASLNRTANTVEDEEFAAAISINESIHSAKSGPLHRTIALARLVMIGFGGLLLFFGLVYFSMTNRDAQGAQYNREFTHESTVKDLNNQLKAARSEEARDKIRTAILEADTAATQLDPAAEAAFSKGRLDASLFIFAGLVMLGSFFAYNAYPRGTMFASLAAALQLLPDIVSMLMYSVTTTSVIVSTPGFNIVRQRTTYLGMTVAIPLLVAIYMLLKGVQASLALHKSQQGDQRRSS